MAYVFRVEFSVAYVFYIESSVAYAFCVYFFHDSYVPDG